VTTFTIDLTPPTSSIVPSANMQSPTPGFPLSIGKIDGETTDAPISTDTGLARVEVTVTDPIGQVRKYSTSDPTGLPHTAINAHDWRWSWIAPSPDLFYVTPGTYTIRVSGVDSVLNVEPSVVCSAQAQACNTFSVVVV
jgi:hypothetical protein